MVVRSWMSKYFFFMEMQYQNRYVIRLGLSQAIEQFDNWFEFLWFKAISYVTGSIHA